ncbi:hypothetical protein I6A60_36645 [Frankia sp. AgB1.9]|uniref:hypothetical protein n=1 Tax=unclassified Frankia TaxID=2632575 RepID=UPI00193288CD|nr:MULTISPECIES: hypothetical protein [unclassified Frankia]MBL7493224.1 hypothetical protein [Frankia sp. AgW1.1]MBL7553342.1 hypothetical protein [Frankia sp. AgB1.9]MBL7624845.1 hypothetical protein [Frankia sp. AgB1.8]
MVEHPDEPYPAGTGGGPVAPPRPGPAPARPIWETDRRVAAARAAWRAASAATADPRWARPGSAAAEGAEQGFAYWPDGWPPDDVPPEAARAVDGWEPEPRRRARGALPAVLAGAGAVLTMIASVLTWATVRAFGMVEFSVSGMDSTQHGRLTFGLGIVVGIAALGLAARPRGHPARLLAGVTGVSGFAIALVALVDIGYLRGGGLFAGSGIEATTTIAPGLWLVLGGGLLSLAAALFARPGRQPDGPAGRLVGPAGSQPWPADAGAGLPVAPDGWAAPGMAAVAEGPPDGPTRETGRAGTGTADPRPGDADAGLMGS